jgi:hypothetical protein
MHPVVGVVIEDCGKAVSFARSIDGSPFPAFVLLGDILQMFILMAVALGHDAIVERNTRALCSS